MAHTRVGLGQSTGLGGNRREKDVPWRTRGGSRDRPAEKWATLNRYVAVEHPA